MFLLIEFALFNECVKLSTMNPYYNRYKKNTQ